MKTRRHLTRTVFTTTEPEEAVALHLELDQFYKSSMWHRIRLRQLGVVRSSHCGQAGSGLTTNLIERDGLDCCICGCPVDPSIKTLNDHRALSIEHFQAKSIRCHDYLWNLGIAHRRCNTAKLCYEVDLADAFYRSLPLVRRAQDWRSQNMNSSIDWFGHSAAVQGAS